MVKTAVIVFSQPPMKAAERAQILKEADAKAAQQALTVRRKEHQRQRQRRQAAAVAATCYTCGRGPAAEQGGAGLKLCGGCRKVRFCSVECSKKGWKQGHKAECKAAAAAAAGAPSSTR